MRIPRQSEPVLRIPAPVKHPAGLGDMIKTLTGKHGFEPCGGCAKRPAALNRWASGRSGDPARDRSLHKRSPVMSSSLPMSERAAANLVAQVPGLAELRAVTRGDPRVVVAHLPPRFRLLGREAHVLHPQRAAPPGAAGPPLYGRRQRRDPGDRGTGAVVGDLLRKAEELLRSTSGTDGMPTT